MKTYVILGGNGVFGVHLIIYLLRNHPDIHVIAVGRKPEKIRPFSLHWGIDDGRYEYHNIHIANFPDRVSDLIRDRQAEVVVNFAAHAEVASSWRVPFHYYETNLVALSKILKNLEGENRLKKWVQIGSSEVYGAVEKPVDEDAPLRPSTPYSLSKMAADIHLEALHKAVGFPMNIIRPSNAYGPGQQLYRIIPRTALCALLGRKLPLQGGGKAVKSYMHAQDLAAAIYLIAERAPLGKLYNAGPGEGVTIRRLVELVCEKIGAPFETVVEVVPDRLMQDSRYLLDSSRIAEDLDWRPTIDLDEGIAETTDWVREHLDVLKDLPTEFHFEP